MLCTFEELQASDNADLLKRAQAFMMSRLMFYIAHPDLLPLSDSDRAMRFVWHYIEDNEYKAGIEFMTRFNEQKQAFELVIIDMLTRTNCDMSFNSLISDLEDWGLEIKFLCKTQEEFDFFFGKIPTTVEFIKLFD